MAKVRLTDKYLATVTAPAGKRLEVFDQHPQGAGLMLRVTDGGIRTWLIRYRTADGQHRRLTLGRYPDITLSDARTRAVDAQRQARDGGDPAGDKQRRRAEAKAQPLKTFADLAETYFTACRNGEWKPRGKRKRESTIKGEEWLWTKHIKPDLGELRLEDVTPAAVKKRLRAIVAAGHEVTSNRVRAQIRQVFNFAIAERRLKTNPVADVAALGSESPRQRVLRDEELKAVWRALTDPAGLRKPPKPDEKEGPRVYVSEPVGIALKLLMLSLTRRAELAAMRTDEIDLQQATWAIPGDRTKNGRPMLVMLSPAAVDLIREALAARSPNPERERRNWSYVFPSPRTEEKPITASALSHALRDLRLALGLERLSPHDLRRTAATIMSSERLSISPFLIGRLLNHTTETGGAAAVTLTTYALHDFAAEKRRALDAWAHLLLHIVHGEPAPSNVVLIPRAEAGK